MLQKMYRTATRSREVVTCFLSTGIGFLISLTTLNAFWYPAYVKMMLTRALARSFPLSVVPSKEFLKLARESGMRETPPPKMTKPVIEMLYVPLSATLPLWWYLDRDLGSQDEGEDLEHAKKVRQPKGIFIVSNDD